MSAQRVCGNEPRSTGVSRGASSAPRADARHLAWALCLASACAPAAPAADADARDAAGEVTSDAVAPPADAIDEADAAEPPNPPPPTSEPGRHDVVVGETRRIVQSAGLPMETPATVSNNNLDVLRHSDGRIYLAWRSAPNHFASTEVAMNVVSSTDETNWRFETRFMIGRDVREPRLLSLNGSVFLYIARLGTSELGFDPQGMSVAERRPDGTWTTLDDSFYPGRFIPWRTRTERGRPYMLTYENGQNIYLFNNEPMNVQLLTTDDGRHWRGVNAMMPTVYRGGGSETDMVLGDDGTLFAVIRNEAGDDTGWGSLVCRAPAADISRWNCRHDPKKYDSPYMFWYDGEAYLIGRRHLTATGNYDLTRGAVPPLEQRGAQSVRNQLAYSNSKKRCSLWRYVQSEDRIAYITDLPSRGDTCFASALTLTNPGEFAVYNYSSDVDGPDVPWGVGQRNPTYIYRTVLRFTRRPGS